MFQNVSICFFALWFICTQHSTHNIQINQVLKTGVLSIPPQDRQPWWGSRDGVHRRQKPLIPVFFSGLKTEANSGAGALTRAHGTWIACSKSSKFWVIEDDHIVFSLSSHVSVQCVRFFTDLSVISDIPRKDPNSSFSTTIRANGLPGLHSFALQTPLWLLSQIQQQSWTFSAVSYTLLLHAGFMF